MNNHTKLFIPAIGTVLELTKDWTVALSSDKIDNRAILCRLNYPMGVDGKLTLPAGSVIVMHRISFTRAKKFDDTIEFKIWETPIPELQSRMKIKGYFRVKISDINGMECIVK